MNEFDVLEKIASNLTSRKSSAALSNYMVLCNNIRHLNASLEQTISKLDSIFNKFHKSTQDHAIVKSEYSPSSPSNNVIPVVARILLNDIAIFTKLLNFTKADERNGITIETVSKLSRNFEDYNNLATATRQYIDSVVSDSYQVSLLSPKAINYHVLVSLNSFHKFSTKSLYAALFNPEIESALAEFNTLRFNDWANSHITECAHSTFAKKVDFLMSTHGHTAAVDISDKFKNIFKFTSEFTHIGYVSTFYSTTVGAEVIFGDDIGPYLPSTENHSELKYEILETAINALLYIYFPSLKKCINDILIPASADPLVQDLSCLQEDLKKSLASRNAEYFFFVKHGLVGSKEHILLTCMCGATRAWESPHSPGNLYCASCGSGFRILEIAGDPGYIITSAGPIKVIGSSVPEFSDLPREKQKEILAQVEKLRAGAPAT